MTCDEALGSAAVALLTADPVEAAVDAHLDGCVACRAELARLAPMPGVLAMLDPQELDILQPTDPVGPALLNRLLAAAARDRRRRRARMLAVAAAAVLVVIVPLAVWGAQLRHQTVTSAAPAAQISWSATDASTGVSGEVKVWKSAWGSDLSVSVSGVRSGTRCTIVVVTKDGTSQTAASWAASYTGTAQVRGNVAAPVSSIVRIEIVDDTGKVLLRI